MYRADEITCTPQFLRISKATSNTSPNLIHCSTFSTQFQTPGAVASSTSPPHPHPHTPPWPPIPPCKILSSRSVAPSRPATSPRQQPPATSPTRMRPTTSQKPPISTSNIPSHKQSPSQHLPASSPAPPTPPSTSAVSSSRGRRKMSLFQSTLPPRRSLTSR